MMRYDPVGTCFFRSFSPRVAPGEGIKLRREEARAMGNGVIVEETNDTPLFPSQETRPLPGAETRRWQ